jgi:hypothetical protein
LARRLFPSARRPIRNSTGTRLRVERLDERILPSGTDPVQIDQQGGWQFFSAAATDAQGNSVVVYNSIGDDGTSYQKVYARRVDPQGNPVGDPFRVNTDESSDMVPGGIAMAPDGRYVIVWFGAGPGHDGTDIYARRYNADDTPADAVESASTSSRPGCSGTRP